MYNGSMSVYDIFPPECTEDGFRGGGFKYMVFRFLCNIVFHFVLFYGNVVIAEGGVMWWYSY